MSSRREFLKNIACASAGAFLPGGAFTQAAEAQSQAASNGQRRQVMVGGQRVKTVDFHCHVTVPEAADVLKGTSLEKRGGGGQMLLTPERVERMNRDGVDMQVVSINPYWYSAERDLASRLIDFQNQKLSTMCAVYPDRFAALASVAMQFPDLAAQQLEDAVKHIGLHGAAIGGSVEGEELSTPKFDPFWAKAEELQAVIFMHPQDSVAATGVANRVHYTGYDGAVLSMNVIGNPLETALFISHLIFDGTLDRFPNLKICCAHGGGFLTAYPDRMDHGCLVFPQQCKTQPKKRPSEYLKQLYFDSLVFTPEAVRHLVAVCGAGQIVMGTDNPIPWVTDSPVDLILATPGLSNAEQSAMLGGNARKLLGISG
jgi:predicted TIM-barrel fold metal-dependent hydrolase